MTPTQINILTQLIKEITKAKPEIEPEEFMFQHWQPFLKTLELSDRRMAWQLYLRAQVTDLHILVEYLKNLPQSDLQKLRSALTQFVSIESTVRDLGKEGLAA